MQPPAPPMQPTPNGASATAPSGAGPAPATPPLPTGPATPAPAQPQPDRPIPPPVITDASNIRQRPDAADIKNPFERVATMLVDASADTAGRLARSLNEQPADTVQPDPQTVHEMMQFSPYGTDAPKVFWQVHDQLLQQAANANDPDPYAVAERGALDQVFPYRSKLALLDVLGPDEKVARAEELAKISERATAKGHTPESMPFNVGPQALSSENAVMPAQPPQGGVS